MDGDLFAGIPVRDYDAAVAWYSRLFGAAPAFLPNDREAVWELGEHRYVFFELAPERAGTARHLLFVEELDRLEAAIAERGLEPAAREILDNGVRKITYRDPDGSELGFGGAPAAP